MATVIPIIHLACGYIVRNKNKIINLYRDFREDDILTYDIGLIFSETNADLIFKNREELLKQVFLQEYLAIQKLDKNNIEKEIQDFLFANLESSRDVFSTIIHVPEKKLITCRTYDDLSKLKEKYGCTVEPTYKTVQNIIEENPELIYENTNSLILAKERRISSFNH